MEVDVNVRVSWMGTLSSKAVLGIHDDVYTSTLCCHELLHHQIASVMTNIPTPCTSQPSGPSGGPSGGLHVHPLEDQMFRQFDNMTPHCRLKMWVRFVEVER